MGKKKETEVVRVVLRVRQALAERVKARASERGVSIAEAADEVVGAGLTGGGTRKGGAAPSADTMEAVRVFAAERGVGVGDALDTLVTSGLHRLAALTRYAEKQRQKREGGAT